MILSPLSPHFTYTTSPQWPWHLDRKTPAMVFLFSIAETGCGMKFNQEQLHTCECLLPVQFIPIISPSAVCRSVDHERRKTDFPQAGCPFDCFFPPRI